MDDIIKRIANLEREVSVKPHRNEIEDIKNHLSFVETNRIGYYDYTTLKSKVELTESSISLNSRDIVCLDETLEFLIDKIDTFIDTYEIDKKHIIYEIEQLKSKQFSNQHLIVSGLFWGILTTLIIKYI